MSNITSEPNPALEISEDQTNSKTMEKLADKKILLGIGLMALAGIIYGTQGPLIKWAYANGTNVTTMLTLRFAIALVGVWGLLLIQRRRLPLRQPPRKLAFLFFLGALFITNSLFYYLAIQQMEIGTTTLLVYCFPALVVLWSVLIFKEPINRLRIIALLLSLLGCALMVDPVAALGAASGFSLLGAVFALGSAFSNSWYMVLAGHFGRGVPGLVAAGYGLPVTTLGFFLWGVVAGSLQFNMPPAAWACCLAIGLLTAVAIACTLVGLTLAGPSRGAMTITTEPAVGVLLGVVLLGEDLSLIKFVGGALIISAIFLLSRRTGR